LLRALNNYREIAVAKASKLHGIKLLTPRQTLDLIEQSSGRACAGGKTA
jgi:hypothetical protein